MTLQGLILRSFKVLHEIQEKKEEKKGGRDKLTPMFTHRLQGSNLFSKGEKCDNME